MGSINEDTALYGNIDIVTGKATFVGSKEECEEERSKEKVIENIRESYEMIKEQLKTYLDLKEEYYTIIALWIIGTYLHKDFDSYPYLFFNAMRGSGKSRALRLICKLSNDGEVMASPTEAVLFRTKGTLGIDEFEGVASKEKATIRELLNGAYKKGIKIARMKKKKVLGNEEQVVEEFEPYRPIVMANIWGMDEVLGDRCITLVLEKSNDPIKTRLAEDFENNEKLLKITNFMKTCRLCRYVIEKNINTAWNNYIFERYKTSLTSLTYITSQTSLTALRLNNLFNKIHDSNIMGRNLELFLPLFFIADLIDAKIVEELLVISKEITESKKHDEEIESVDVMLYDFVSRQEEGLNWISLKDFFNQFKEFSDYLNEDWLNLKWMGRALKRLNLTIDRRKRTKGREVILNIAKAKEKIKMFKVEK
jgi:hypothetical protein